MAFTPFSAGQRLTAGALNLALLSGVVVFRAYRNAGQSIPAGAESVSNALVWDAVDLDRYGAGAVGSSVWTCPLTGWWVLEGGVAFNGISTGTVRDGCWFVNGALAAAGRSRVALPSGGFNNTQATGVDVRAVPYLLNQGDTVQLVPAQDSAGPLSTATGSLRNYISIRHGGPT